MGHMAERAQIVVKGIVQGVGFRPYVFNLADALGLKGYVTNTSEGVFIDIEGARVSEFIERLRNEAPPLSRITDLSFASHPVHGYSEFTIRRSLDAAEGLLFTLVSPDVSICDDCLKELLDPADRRYLYPFINCTNCGPRYSITRSVPYDRPNTTMDVFAMCPDCLGEYRDPRNRRFHAQPNACPVCGPQVEFRLHNAECGVRNGEAIEEAIKLLKGGGIVAVKGLGGFHIACDAANDEAVGRLREKKRKSNKPFAVMAPSLDSMQRFCIISEEEKDLLRSNRRPIVLLRKKDGHVLSDVVSPNNQFIGAMLPYTPLHYLLFEHPLGAGVALEEPHFTALVMTSGNLSEEPIVRDNDEAENKLSLIVDGFLLHNRDIFMRVDDSVVRIPNADCGLRNEGNSSSSSQSEISFIRRSRGYAPDPIMLHDEGAEVLGCGADLKNTFTLTKGKFAIPSHHIGDMENYETVRYFEESLQNLKSVYRAEPQAIVHDLHPGYLSTQWAIQCGMRNAECGMKTYGIQHHYAHIGSVMAEHGLKSKVIGIALDGTGYGTDGNLWGGEFLIAGINGFERAGHFQYVALPGGEAAIREPWKTAVSFVFDAAGNRAWNCLESIGFVERYGKDALQKIATVKRSSELSPLSSGAGRLFDAVSALLGICETNTFEGEAAMSLESCTRPGIDEEYHIEFKSENGYTVVDFSFAIIAIIDDMTQTVPKEVIATRFHNTVASVIRNMARRLNGIHGIREVTLSGGTFQNQYLLQRTDAALSMDGMTVLTNIKVPCNDGGISLGQAYIVRERLKKQFGLRNSECGI
jgi:hydrogenase maturation protein HypF